MKACIYGLGAIGGLMAARLASAGHEVSAVARGATLAAVRDHGLTLIETRDGQEVTRRFAVTVAEDPARLDVPDVVIIAVKTTGLADIAPRVAPLLGPETTIVSAMNGVPWWFLHGLGPAVAGLNLAGLHLDSVDPQGRISAALPPQRVVGVVTHLAAASPEPGVVKRVAQNRLMVGEPTGGYDTPRAQAIIGALRDGGFEVDGVAGIQREIWYKLWGNMTMNPVSAITGATLDRILGDREVRDFVTRCMVEGAAVGAKIGLPITDDPEDRHKVTEKLGAFRTSMLQDVDAGRPIELDALLGVVREIAAQVGVATPNIDALFGLTRLSAQVRRLY